MAKRANDDPPPPVRTTRQTRSRSLEPSSQQSTSKGARATKNSSRPSTANGPAKRTTRAKTAELPELTTVAEDADIDQAQLDAQLQAQAQDQAEQDADVDEFRDRRVSGGNVSVMSGTTAKTSFSQEEVETMDHEVMIDVLPGLLTACNELSRLIIPQGANTHPETWKEIRRSGSKHNKLYNNRISTINVHKPNFGSQEYISPRHVLKALLGVQDLSGVPAASWRPDNLIYKINLIQMLNSILITCNPLAWTVECTYALERLHSAFLESIAGSEFSFPIFEFYLMLTAHFTIAQLEYYIESEPHFSPHDIIESQFFDEEQLKDEAALGLSNASSEDREQASVMALEYVNDIKAYFENDNAVNARAANNRLKAAYQWDELRSDALQYADARMKALNERIERVGGTQQILQMLGEEIQRRVSEKMAQSIRQSLGKGSKTRRSFGGAKSLAKLREREKQLEAASASAPAPVAQMTAPPVAEAAQPPNTAPQRPLQADVVTDFAQSTAPVQRNGKQKARWTDPQPNAQRVSPITDSPRTQKGRNYFSTQSSSRKRGFDEIEEDEGVPDPTQDEGFQTDSRDFAAADERRRKVNFQRPAHRQPAPSPRAEASNSRTSQPPIPRPSFNSTIQSTEARSSPAKRQRMNPGSAIPDPIQPPAVDEDELPPEATWERKKLIAKINRLTAAENRAPRSRSKWEDAEEERLINLIAEYGNGGIKWAMLKAVDKEDGDMLSMRTAEDLRFKARNMKVIWLLADSSLPPNWEYVALAKKEIEKLHSRGVRYDQAPLRQRHESTMEA